MLDSDIANCDSGARDGTRNGAQDGVVETVDDEKEIEMAENATETDGDGHEDRLDFAI